MSRSVTMTAATVRTPEKVKGGSRAGGGEEKTCSTTAEKVRGRAGGGGGGGGEEKSCGTFEKVRGRAAGEEKATTPTAEKVKNNRLDERTYCGPSVKVKGSSRTPLSDEKAANHNHSSSIIEKMKSRLGVEEKVAGIVEKVKGRAAADERIYSSAERAKGSRSSAVAPIDEKPSSTTTATSSIISASTTTTSEKVKSSSSWGNAIAGGGDEKVVPSPAPVTPSPYKSRGAGGEEKIFVTVRVRPLSARELAKGDVEDWECPDDRTVASKHPLHDRASLPSLYTFDKVFGPDCPTQRVYEEGAKDVALSSLTGLNSTIFAYGQTSSGKTFTMRGVTETAVEDIYDFIEKNQDRNFLLKVAALEIYNEIVKDLLNPESGALRLLDDPERGTVVERLQEEVVRDASHLRQILAICEAQRQVGETTLNDNSSRSHQIIRVTVESFPRELPAGVISNALVASLNFVDLAGSERASQTLSEGTRLKEGGHINRSLLTLSTCIRKLSVGGKTKGHIPYRDSKLTRILQHSLGGNARTAIICTMSPARVHVEQSRNTLFFATQAKEVTNTAHVNLVVDDKVLVKQLQKEVARLEASLRNPEPPISTGPTPEDLLTSEALLKAKEQQIQKMAFEMEELVRQRDVAQTRLNEVTERMKEAEQQAEERARELDRKASELQQLESETPSRAQTPRTPSWGGVQDEAADAASVAANNSRALVVVPVRRNLSSDLSSAGGLPQQQQLLLPPINPRRSSLTRQSNSAASLMLVQEIRKLEHLQDELGEDASRALEALQKEVECLRLAQAGMNQDAAATIKKLQDEIRNMHALRATNAATAGAPGRDRDMEANGPEDPEGQQQPAAPLREELLRLQALGESERSEANSTIATLEEQLESVQKSLDKMVLNSEHQVPPPPSSQQHQETTTTTTITTITTSASAPANGAHPQGAAAIGEEEATARTPPSRRRKSGAPLTMSSISRQRLLAPADQSPRSPQSGRRAVASAAVENNENTPPPRSGGLARENASPRLGENNSNNNNSHSSPGSKKQKGGSTVTTPDSAKETAGAMHRRSASVDIRKMQNLFKTAAEDNIKSIRTYVTELKERVAKLQYQKQLLVCQVLELEANADTASEGETVASGEEAEEARVEVAPVVPWSPSAWRKQYDKQRRTIIELWDACQVSIIHRTQFYLLFKGDPADAIYLEVELRRLNWLQDHCATAAFEAAQSGYQSTDEASTSPLAAGEKSLRREREMLVKRMRARMTPEERAQLFSEWGIPLDVKQRKAQLCNKIWTDPFDMHHVQASAEVVARIVGFWEPGSTASKEMFGLTFAAPSNSRNPLLVGWNSISTLLNF